MAALSHMRDLTAAAVSMVTPETSRHGFQAPADMLLILRNNWFLDRHGKLAIALGPLRK